MLLFTHEGVVGTDESAPRGDWEENSNKEVPHSATVTGLPLVIAENKIGGWGGGGEGVWVKELAEEVRAFPWYGRQ